MDLYTWTTPNGFKPLIMLEEVGLPYKAIAVNLGKNEQHAPEYLRINPNGKIPALVDRDAGVQVFESGAILIYLAEKTGKLLPAAGQPRAEVIEWLMFQMSAVGPMFGRLGHFRGARRDDTYALERFTDEVTRITKVLEDRLVGREHLAGEYSIADIATVTWVSGLPTHFRMDMAPYPNVSAWIERVTSRPAVKRALAWRP
jgi:GST-like protein